MSDPESINAALRPLDPDARMDAYYYGFERTGIGVVDAILSEVATAGKAYHGTEYWMDDYDEATWPGREDRRSHQDRIQDAANNAARIIRDLLS